MIQLLIEPSYGANLWAQAYLTGIREEARKRGWELQTLTEEAEAAEEPVLLVGSAVGWLKSHLARLGGPEPSLPDRGRTAAGRSLRVRRAGLRGSHGHLCRPYPGKTGAVRRASVLSGGRGETGSLSAPMP